MDLHFEVLDREDTKSAADQHEEEAEEDPIPERSQAEHRAEWHLFGGLGGVLRAPRIGNEAQIEQADGGSGHRNPENKRVAPRLRASLHEEGREEHGDDGSGIDESVVDRDEPSADRCRHKACDPGHEGGRRDTAKHIEEEETHQQEPEPELLGAEEEEGDNGRGGDEDRAEGPSEKGEGAVAVPGKIARGGKLKRGHQGSEGGDNAEGHGVGAEVLGQQDDRRTEDDLEADRVVELEPVEVEDPSRVGDGKNPPRAAVALIGGGSGITHASAPSAPAIPLGRFLR